MQTVNFFVGRKDFLPDDDGVVTRRLNEGARAQDVDSPFALTYVSGYHGGFRIEIPHHAADTDAPDR